MPKHKGSGSTPKGPGAAIPESHHRVVEQATQGVLCTVRHSDGKLSANPVGYTWDGEVFRISTLKSRVKYKNVLADSRVALCIVSPEDSTVYVEVRGHATLEDDPDRTYMRHQFRTQSGVEPPDDLDPPEAERVIIVLRPEQASAPLLYGGRFSKGP